MPPYLRNFFLASTPFITELPRTQQKTRIWVAAPQHCINPKFRNPATSFHSLAPFNPPNIRRANCAATSFLSCRVACSRAPHTTPPRLLLLGHTLPRSSDPVTATSRPPLHRGHGHGASLTTSPGPGRQGSRPPLHHGQGLKPTLVTSLGPGRHGLSPPPAAARLLAHPAPATGPAWLQRIPPGSGAYTVRLPGDRSR